MEKIQVLSSGGRTLSPTREIILRALEASAKPLTVGELARLLSVHENTVRMHLDALHIDGFVTRTKNTESPTRGRPAWKWSRKSRRQSPYVALVTSLAGQLVRESNDPQHTAREAGKEWGRALAQHHGTTEDTEHQHPRDVVTEILRAEGFAPVTKPNGRADLRQCPFSEVARTYPEVVCSMHLGMVQGALEVLGATDVGTTLTPFTSLGVCSLSLQIAEPS